jgi:ribosomal protein S18 acetylase RimI-like enzyme
VRSSVLGGYDGEISAIYVLRASQRRGAGGRLMTTMALDLSGRGFAGAGLWVLRDNPTARRFYESLGGQVVDEREDRRAEAVFIEVAYGWTDLLRLKSYS